MYSRCYYSNQSPNDPHVVTCFMGAHQIERKDEVRDLGILTDRRFSFGAQIERTTSGARQSMGYIKLISIGQFHTRSLVVLIATSSQY